MCKSDIGLHILCGEQFSKGAVRTWLLSTQTLSLIRSRKMTIMTAKFVICILNLTCQLISQSHYKLKIPQQHVSAYLKLNTDIKFSR